MLLLLIYLVFCNYSYVVFFTPFFLGPPILEAKKPASFHLWEAMRQRQKAVGGLLAKLLKSS